MFYQQTYFDLIDDNTLPPGARFVDPFDQTPFLPQSGETLINFISRFNQSRIEKNYDPLHPAELRMLIIDCFYESASPKVRKDYFVEKTATPSLAEIFQFSKTLAKTLIWEKKPAPKQRQARAKLCNSGCTFHSTSSTWKDSLTNTIKTVIGIKDLTSSEEEKKLGKCNLCGCALKAKVAFPLVPVLAELTPEQIDRMLRTYSTDAFKKCWIFEESLKDPAAHELLYRKLATLNSNAPRVLAALQTMQKAKEK